MEFIITIALLIIGFAWIAYQNKSKGSDLDNSKNDDLVQQIINLKSELSAKEERIKILNEKILETQESKEETEERLTKEFENLAHKILDLNSEKFKKQNKEQIDTLLNPLSEQIEKFKKKVEDTNEKGVERNAMLMQKINSLESLNNKLSQDALNLTNALKGDSKTQGDWGENRLELLLEKSGLSNGVHFSTQGGYKDDEGKLKKPDFIIYLPDNKHLIIDSKVSLTAYVDYYNAEDDITEQQAIKRHLDSIKRHYMELSDKDYPNLYGINAPDHVLMFIPNEPALMLALNEDKNLYINALEKNIVLVSASTLLATLSTVASIWKQEDQKRNALEIAKEGGLLYDKFEGFVQDLIKVGKSLKSSKDSYEDAMNKLTDGRGNIIKKIENLKDLGAKTKKSLPQNIIDRANNDEDN
ncbi:MAG: DNA recombination protein RmuC [Flavobacteriales bacterium]|jgi:DNA recombination protein RmuC|nr:DNA recombination protein RmuC [Flavobacteriales bacterium]MDG1916963.1 DNA recombination protein RmuC [Flavobacteriales bacterium]|tara:strand:+ start:20147 stop:21388 length:1242 start_codon:yes stop_codon:yes gene_type:complete